MSNKKVKVGILGFGTVGYGVYRILTENKRDILNRSGVELEVVKALVKDMGEPNAALAPDVCTASFDDIKNADLDIVIECMGGAEPARTFILASLDLKRHVATSNKEVIAKHWPELEEAAKKNGVGLYIEATVGGGIPVIRTILDGMQANNIKEVMGIINGTTNYILTQMADMGAAFGDVLHEAQGLGYAEADPKNDVEGYDVMYKLSILCSLAFNTKIPIDSIFREGITHITPLDIKIAKEFGFVIKLLAIGKRLGDNVEVRVHPTMIPFGHPLAAVSGVFNAVFMNGHAVDDIMLYGRGAGQMPTASAVVSDVVYACTHAPRYTMFGNTQSASLDIRFVSNWSTAAYIHLLVKDMPGVLAEVAGVMGQNSVSIAVVKQTDVLEKNGNVPLVFITHTTKEENVMAALKEIKNLDCVVDVVNMIRVEE